MSRFASPLALLLLAAVGARGVRADAIVVTRARVRSVEVEEAATHELEESDGFDARCVWTVAGSVGHWGCIHQRRNRYTAEFTVRPVDGTWKITDLELLDEERP